MSHIECSDEDFGVIDFNLKRMTLRDIFNIEKSASELKELFYQAALKLSSDVIREMIAFRLNLILSPQNFSIEKVLNKQAYFNTNDGQVTTINNNSDILKQKFNETTEKIQTSLISQLSQSSIEALVSECELEVKSSLESDGWLSLFPGKELIELVSKELRITNTISLQNSLIKEFSSRRELIDPEIIQIFEKINLHS